MAPRSKLRAPGRGRARMGDEGKIHAHRAGRRERAGRKKPEDLAEGPDRPADPTASSPSSNEHFRTLLDVVPGALAELDADGRFTYANREARHLLGANLNEMLARVHRSDRAEVEESLRKLFASRGRVCSAYRIHSPDPQLGRDRGEGGDWTWVETQGATHPAADGSPRAVLFTRDVTQTRRGTEELRESEERYRSLADNATDLILELDEEGSVLYISPNSTQLIGIPPESLTGLGIEDSAARMQSPRSVDGQDIMDGFRQTLLAGEAGSETRWRVTRPDGSTAWFESRSQTYRRTNGDLRVIVISRDVTQRMRAEQALEQSELRYRIVNAMSRDMLTETNSRETLVYISPNCEELLGHTIEEMVGSSPFDYIHPDDVDEVRRGFAAAMTTREPADFGIFRARRKDGSWRWFEGAGITYERADGELRLLGRAHDITERRRRELERQQLEEQMQQAQKLEGLGVMAGGIAHDFNNLLTPILGNASMALRDLPDVTAIRARLEKIQRATQRAAALTGQMLAYAGQGSLVIEPVDLSRLVREMGELLASAASGRAVLQYDLPSGLPTIEADAAQLTQVVMNLITNALEAVAEGEGAIEVRTGTVEASELTPVQMILGGELIAGTYVFFEVRDSGSGMSAETREKIFDPFFTTKFTGRGLGLAAVLGIVHSHRGAIEIDTEIGRGTRFRVFFPSAACLLAPTSPELLDSVEWRGSGTILVVDDDDGVRELMEQTLLRAGFAVLTAADGRTGIEVFRKYADSIRIVLLDRTMPLVSGEETLDAMRRIRPDACIVLVSGYSQEMAAEYFSGRGLAGFLQKPFIPLTLIARVRELLESD